MFAQWKDIMSHSPEEHPDLFDIIYYMPLRNHKPTPLAMIMKYTNTNKYVFHANCNSTNRQKKHIFDVENMYYNVIFFLFL